MARGKDEGNQVPEAARHLRPVTEHDPFNLDEGGYSPDNVYTRSVDGKGHKETLHTPVPPQVFGQIAELVAQRVIPEYRSPQDFVRDAVIHRLRYIGETSRNAAIVRTVNHEVFLCRTEALATELADLERVITSSGDLMERAKRAADYSMLEVAIEQAREKLDDLREPYRGRLEQVVTEYAEELDRSKKK